MRLRIYGVPVNLPESTVCFGGTVGDSCIDIVVLVVLESLGVVFQVKFILIQLVLD